MWGLVALWASCWLPGTLTGRTLPARDVAATQLPWRQEWRTAVGGGHLPLWDAASSGGRTDVGQPQRHGGLPGHRGVPPGLAGAGRRLVDGAPSPALRGGLLRAGPASRCARRVRRWSVPRSGASRGWPGRPPPSSNFQASLAWLPWALAGRGEAARKPDSGRGPGVGQRHAARPGIPGRRARERGIGRGHRRGGRAVSMACEDLGRGGTAATGCHRDGWTRARTAAGFVLRDGTRPPGIAPGRAGR